MNKLLYAVARKWFSSIFRPVDQGRIAAACEVISASAPETADGAFLKAYLTDAEIVVTSCDTAALDAEVMVAASASEISGPCSRVSQTCGE